ncbi:uncharacterized protein LOC117321241 [Pecten maximus]|uniref:uncharacterized protein LOC117321241 n=1 Tax=Pecten maximus TaxID=6579 RepID=UPI001458C0BA|nr:uncharacterized protein LOC117321241 [Pecten maximus]XP_033731599.1 uncharacterized protein LOC117321241 [Pecten maximus]
MERYNRHNDRGSPPSVYPGHARPYTSPEDKGRTRLERPASGSKSTRPGRNRKPDDDYRQDKGPSTSSASNSELSDLRKLLHVASELQKIDLEAALHIYQGLMRETKNDQQMKSEETYLKQLASGTDPDVTTGLEKQMDAILNENEKLKQEKGAFLNICNEMKEAMESMKTESKQRASDLKRKEEELKKLKEEKDSLNTEKNEALTRLSKELGMKLTDNNPAIADLSDPNRAMKIGEKYSELYDNEWTDALDILCADGSNEESNVRKLLDVFKKCYELCVEVSEKQMASLQMVLLNPGTPANYYSKQAWSEESGPLIAKTSYKQLKDIRKVVSQSAVDNIYKEHAHTKIGWIEKDIPTFVKKCIEVCWLMCVLDPPVVIGSDAVVGSTFDTNVYKNYTNSGTTTSYTVWLPLFLYKGGPLLIKGVVQPIKERKARKRTEETKPKKPVVATRLQNRFEETDRSTYSRTGTATKSTISYEKPKLDRKGTTAPSEKHNNSSYAKRNYEEHRVTNELENRASPVSVSIQSNYRSHQDTYRVPTTTNYHQDVVNSHFRPYQFEYNGKYYVHYNGSEYPLNEYLRIYGTTRGVSDL